MPLIFVHGVKTRRNSSYDKEVKARNGFFTRYTLRDVLNPSNLRTTPPFNPYWGDLGSKSAHLSIPRERKESLGIEEEEREILLLINAIAGELGISKSDNMLREIAQQTSLENVIDLL